MNDCGAIILAGGGARRFGSDKLKAELAGKPLLQHVIQAALSEASHVYIVGGNREEQVKAFPGGRLSYCPDLYPGCGPLAGFLSGLSCSEYDYNYLLAGDMPLVSPGILRLLKDTMKEEISFLYLQTGRPQPLVSLTRRRLLEPVRERVEGGILAMKALLDLPGSRSLQFDNASQLQDVDTKKDLERIRVFLSDRSR